MEGGAALEGVLLELALAADLEGGALELDAEGGVFHEGLDLLGGAEVKAEERFGGGLFRGVSQPGGGVGDEDERDDDDGEKEEEQPFEVLLEGALNPGNHVGKGEDGGRRRGGFKSGMCGAQTSREDDVTTEIPRHGDGNSGGTARGGAAVVATA